MIKLLQLSAAIALGSLFVASLASAGLNSGAVAQMYWQTGSTGAAIATRNNTNGTCQLVVTAKGLANFAGCDVQVQIIALDGGAIPAAWQGQPGGCAAGFIIGYPGGRGGTIYRNVFTTSPAVPNPVVSQNGEIYNTGDCKTPHGVGLLWLSEAGSGGAARTTLLEYALWAITFDLANSVDPADGVTPCEGGASDPNGVRGICLSPNFRGACSDPQRGASLQLLDGNFDLDYPGFAAGKSNLTWSFTNTTGGPCCYWCDAIKLTTWGHLKRLYN